MSNIVDVIESIHPRCLKLDIDLDFLISAFSVLGWGNIREFSKRVCEEDCGLVDFLNGLWGMSKSDIRRLIKGQGVKVNNTVPKENTMISELPFIEVPGWKVCVIKKGKNVFDFILV